MWERLCFCTARAENQLHRIQSRSHQRQFSQSGTGKKKNDKGTNCILSTCFSFFFCFAWASICFFTGCRFLFFSIVRMQVVILVAAVTFYIYMFATDEPFNIGLTIINGCLCVVFHIVLSSATGKTLQRDEAAVFRAEASFVTASGGSRTTSYTVGNSTYTQTVPNSYSSYSSLKTRTLDCKVTRTSCGYVVTDVSLNHDSYVSSYREANA
eukprot:m.13017 g.13017  ORF g.13017 m.13017 type:complete len:211 (+) comp7127_c0_seq1:2759-3391(+)